MYAELKLIWVDAIKYFLFKVFIFFIRGLVDYGKQDYNVINGLPLVHFHLSVRITLILEPFFGFVGFCFFLQMALISRKIDSYVKSNLLENGVSKK